MSTIKANTIETSSGGAVTLTKQVAAKMFIDADQTSTQAINDSFNVSTITDGGTGKTSANLTNAHSDGNYGPVQGIHSATNRRIVANSHTASIVKYEVYQESTYTTITDASGITGNTHGDLA